MNFQVLPPLSAEDYAALKADIAARGVLVPVEYDEEGNILDGHHRVQICGELGITTWPKLIRKGLTDTEKRTHARQLNLARRHLDQAARRTLIEEELRENPERSNRQIAASLGVSHPTVADVREQMESTGKVYQLEKTVGADGKERPAHKPIRTRFVDDSDIGKRETLEQAKEIRAEKVQERQEKARAAYEERKVEGGTVADLHALAASGQKFGVIYADPPWSFEVYSVKGKERSAERHYDTQSLEDIKRLPVKLLAADDCALMLWAVMPQLPGAIEVIECVGVHLQDSWICLGQAEQEWRRLVHRHGLLDSGDARKCAYWRRGEVQFALPLTSIKSSFRRSLNIPGSPMRHAQG